VYPRWEHRYGGGGGGKGGKTSCHVLRALVGGGAARVQLGSLTAGPLFPNDGPVVIGKGRGRCSRPPPERGPPKKRNKGKPTLLVIGKLQKKHPRIGYAGLDIREGKKQTGSHRSSAFFRSDRRWPNVATAVGQAGPAVGSAGFAKPWPTYFDLRHGKRALMRLGGTFCPRGTGVPRAQRGFLHRAGIFQGPKAGGGLAG